MKHHVDSLRIFEFIFKYTIIHFNQSELGFDDEQGIEKLQAEAIQSTIVELSNLSVN